MFFRPHLSFWCWILLLPGIATAQGELSSKDGFLLLRNGNLLKGEITQAGDYYLVIDGEESELRMPKDQVEGICRDLNDAYLFKLTTMHGTGVRAQLDMVQWCLRHELYDQADKHLSEAKTLEPANPLANLLSQRLKIARDGSSVPAAMAIAETKVVVPSDLDKVEETLSSEAMEKFTAVVQPLLINRCAAGGCHGAQTKSDLQIIRPFAGQLIQRRATQRNLISALKYIDRDQPERSPLLMVPLGPHGGTGPIFDAKTREQIETLTAWVAQVLQPDAVTPASVQPAITRLPATAGTVQSIASKYTNRDK